MYVNMNAILKRKEATKKSTKALCRGVSLKKENLKNFILAALDGQCCGSGLKWNGPGFDTLTPRIWIRPDRITAPL